MGYSITSALIHHTFTFQSTPTKKAEIKLAHSLSSVFLTTNTGLWLEDQPTKQASKQTKPRMARDWEGNGWVIWKPWWGFCGRGHLHLFLHGKKGAWVLNSIPSFFCLLWCESIAMYGVLPFWTFGCFPLVYSIEVLHILGADFWYLIFLLIIYSDRDCIESVECSG